ncbi:MAG: putative DNA binding domain-containing protein, partial [Muribaculaceae bacterium]|nr:putative DNA binding domain-containing protein [Muribaculaceae bacterium]
MTIEEILTRKEGQTFDCKSFAIEPKGLAVTIVAMANADGGELAVGISDRRREIEGVSSNQIHLNELIRVPYDFCNPTVRATFELIDCVNRNGKPDKILLFHIQPSADLHATQNDECYLRLGDKSRKLTFMERMQLMYDKGVQSFEDTPVMGATIDDLDLESVKDYTDVLGYGKTVIDFLTENQDFVKKLNGVQKISAAAILLFGKNPQRFFPRARVRFIKYKGTEEKVGTQMNVIKDITFEGTILNQIQKMIELLELQIDEPTYLGQDGLFVTKRDYPHFVLQEMTVNACCHRDYSIRGTEIQIKMFDDRLVFESPGTLPGNVRPDNIRHTHFSRNPHIAQFLKAYKFVKEFGEGVDRMCREMTDMDMEPPTYHLNAFILKATAKNRGQTREVWDESNKESN